MSHSLTLKSPLPKKRKQGLAYELRQKESMEARGKLLKPSYRYGSVRTRHHGRRSLTSQLKTVSLAKTREAVINFLKNCPSITKEAAAFATGIRTHLIEQVFHQLNLEGLLHQETRNHAHDTNRERWGGWGCNTPGWAGNVYYLTTKGTELLQPHRIK